ncbi:hypothetical protein BH23PLA1_BH23PLA1_44440 [soil metagenome]
MSEATAWPVEIRIKRAERRLEVDFDDGQHFAYTAELLRVESPSAEAQGHTPSQKVTVGGKHPGAEIEVIALLLAGVFYFSLQ